VAIRKKKKVFICFDFDNDKSLKDSLIGQSKLRDSPFEIIDGSMKEVAAEKDWVKKAKSKIKASDTVIVMLGTKTFKAPGVLKEVKMTNELKIKICQIVGHKDKDCPGVEGAGRLYSWTWDNLKKLLS
jgi:hypothetical protein